MKNFPLNSITEKTPVAKVLDRWDLPDSELPFDGQELPLLRVDTFPVPIYEKVSVPYNGGLTILEFNRHCGTVFLYEVIDDRTPNAPLRLFLTFKNADKAKRRLERKG